MFLRVSEQSVHVLETQRDDSLKTVDGTRIPCCQHVFSRIEHTYTLAYVDRWFQTLNVMFKYQSLNYFSCLHSTVCLLLVGCINIREQSLFSKWSNLRPSVWWSPPGEHSVFSKIVGLKDSGASIVAQ
jgi:hypothetical protein